MAISDKFKKAKSLFATTLNGNINTGTGETITLNSVSGLPTDTEITLTFNRVDAAGNTNASSLVERITGTISGNNLVSYTRGTDGTTEQAHTNGTVIEYVHNAQDINDMVDGILAEHNQDGTHNDINASDIVAASININSTVKVTGTLDEDNMASNSAVKLATQQSIKAYVDTKVGAIDKTKLIDSNSVDAVLTSATSSAVNEITVTNAATGGAPKISATGDDTNIDLELAGKGTGKVKVNAKYGDITADTDGATITFNMATSNVHTVTLGDNRTLAVSNVSVGQAFIIRLVQDGTGSRTVTWFSTIKWTDGSTPVLTTTINKTDVFGFLCTSANNYDGYVIGQNL